MSSIILLLILTIISKTKEYYNLKYGNVIVDYFDKEDCINKSIERVLYPVPENPTLTILNKDDELMSYNYDFDFHSNTILYTNGTGDESEEEKEYLYKRTFVCNGICFKRQNNSDILVPPDTSLAPSYEELNDEYQYYTCIYNNIIKSATISIARYTDRKCKNKLGEEDNYQFNGTDLCWKINDNLSFKPLYYEDQNGKIYYHSYNTSDCTNKGIDYFLINQNYLICDSKCHTNRLDQQTTYKCTFKDNTGYIINLKIILVFLFIFLYL